MIGVPHPRSGGDTDPVPEDFARYTRRMCDTAALGLQAVLTLGGDAFSRGVRLSRVPVRTGPADDELDRLLAVLALVLGRLSNVQHVPLCVVIDELAALAEGDPDGRSEERGGRR
jgi:hypothetical protein